MRREFTAIAFFVIANFALWLLLTIIMPPQQALASDRLFGRVTANPEVVRVAGQEVFTIQAAAGGFTPLERTIIVEKNINNALMGARDHSPASVQVIMINQLPVIRIDGKHVVTVTSECAKFAGTTMEALAAEWAHNIRNVLTQTAMVNQYLAEMSGDYLTTIYNPPYRRARLEAARINHAAISYREDLPAKAVSSDTFEDKGFKNILDKDWVTAKVNFQTALSLNSGNARARYGLSLCLMKEGKFNDAVNELTVARQIDPNDAEVHLALGQCYEAMGNDGAAMVRYREAALLQPDNPEPYLYIADIREEKNDIGQSVIELWGAHQQIPRSEYIRLRRQDQLTWRLNRPF